MLCVCDDKMECIHLSNQTQMVADEIVSTELIYTDVQHLIRLFIKINDETEPVSY